MIPEFANLKTQVLKLTEPMNPEIKAMWIKALRNEYTQCQGNLKRADGFCCLGVLTDLFIKLFPEKARWYPVADVDRAVVTGRYISSQYDEEESSAILIPVVCEWAGLKSRNPRVPIQLHPIAKPFCTLSELNDSGKTFAEIADIIEEHL